MTKLMLLMKELLQVRYMFPTFTEYLQCRLEISSFHHLYFVEHDQYNHSCHMIPQ